VLEGALGTGLVGAAPSGDQQDAPVNIRLSLLVILGFALLPAMAIYLRYKTMHRDLEEGEAIRISALAGAILMALFLTNFLLYDFV
jgi:hypothetical protein